MHKVLSSLVIIGTVSSLVIGLSNAYFSDTETSTGNTFQAGAIDLKVGNESYYNGVIQNGEDGTANTSWALNDITNQLYFNFLDLKPGDDGEDTITLQVNDNPAWACVDIKLTENSDNGCTEPEVADDTDCNAPEDAGATGELADNLNFVFWLDDGDNALEEGEQLLSQGPAAHILNGVTWTLADSVSNHLGLSNGLPLEPNTPYYIGKAWCFGSLTVNRAPPGQGDPITNPGYTCDGSQLDNSTQTDLLKGDITFTAIQSRHNPTFLCNADSVIQGAAYDPINHDTLGLITYQASPGKYEFWFTVSPPGVGFYIAGHAYHNYYEKDPINPGDFCNTTVVPDREPYNIVATPGDTYYWKVFDETANDFFCP